MTAALTLALAHPQALRAAYQPVRCLATGRVLYYEALARLVTERDEYAAGAFLPAARARGALGVFERALVADALSARLDAPVGLNLSAALLLDDALFRALGHHARGAAVHARPVLEFVEDDPLLALAPCAQRISRLRADGWRLALDDFLAGDAAGHLARLAPEFVKLDKAMLGWLGTPYETVAAALAGSLVPLATVVCEGLETPAQAAWARRMGIQAGQGFALGAPALGARAARCRANPVEPLQA